MLRFKGDLKKLKEFDFHEVNFEDAQYWEYQEDDIFESTILIFDNIEPIEVITNNCDVETTTLLDKLFDLIQAGLIEKIEV